MNKKTFQKVSGTKAVITDGEDYDLNDAVAAVLESANAFDQTINSSVIEGERFDTHLVLAENDSEEEDALPLNVLLVIHDKESGIAFIERTEGVNTSKEAKKAIRAIKNTSERIEVLDNDIAAEVTRIGKETPTLIAFTDAKGVGILFSDSKAADRPKAKATVRPEPAAEPAEKKPTAKEAKAAKAKEATTPAEPKAKAEKKAPAAKKEKEVEAKK